jgi:hypothetical protein
MATTITLQTGTGRTITDQLGTFLTPELRELARLEANRWIKSLRLAPYDGTPMRQRFTYRGDSLWWFTEIYLHKMRRFDQAVSVILALERACDAESPVGLSVQTSDATARDAVEAFARGRGLALDLSGPPDEDGGLRWKSYQIGLAAKLSRLRGTASIHKSPKVTAFVHTAFWRQIKGLEGPRQESYIGAVLDAVSGAVGEDNLFCVGVGPRRNFRARRWWDAVAPTAPHARFVIPIERLVPRRALTDSHALWRSRRALAHAVVSGDGIRAAAVFRGYDLWPIVRRELDAVARLQWPWSARAMDEAGAAMDALSSSIAVTYAEAGGWGRAIMLEARRRGIRSIGLQHGFIYRHWLNYLHEPDEMAPMGADRGCPIPDMTLLFDRYAEQHLLGEGRFPAGAVRVTGNARLDQLIAQCAALQPMRDALRREFCAFPDQPLAVLAAKFGEIKDVLPELAAAVRSESGMRLVIKPHPAETADLYQPLVNEVANISIADGTTDLARLLTAADALVTMNSTVAIDGLVLGLPALVVGLPNNLSPFVDAGAMVGADGAENIRHQLHALLYDPEVRRRVVAAGAAFARDHALASDGHAARRTAEGILAET